MNLIVLAGTCIIKDKKVLLLKQPPQGDQGNKWGPPAGHGNDHEGLLEIAKRETKEETNLKIKITGLVQAAAFHHKGKDYLIALYSAGAPRDQKITPQEAEVSDYVWASLEEIQNDTFPLRKKFLKEPLILSLTQNPLPIDSFKLLGEIE